MEEVVTAAFKDDGLEPAEGDGLQPVRLGTQMNVALATEGNMRPTRENVSRSGQTYFVSSQTSGRRPFFRHERWAVLLQEVLQHYRGTSYLLHAYVIMPDHFHILLSPQDSLERAIQNIKGGYSFRARSAFDWHHDIWQVGFSDHRIRDIEDWQHHIEYIRKNPTREDYSYIALNLDPVPQRLKPQVVVNLNGGAEAPPLQKAVRPNRL